MVVRGLFCVQKWPLCMAMGLHILPVYFTRPPFYLLFKRVLGQRGV